jgi:hypothetical protein
MSVPFSVQQDIIYRLFTLCLTVSETTGVNITLHRDLPCSPVGSYSISVEPVASSSTLKIGSGNPHFVWEHQEGEFSFSLPKMTVKTILMAIRCDLKL